MKTWITIFSLVASLGIPAIAADGLPEGTYEGTGHWRGQDGSSGQYASKITFEAGRMISEVEYEHQGKHQERHTLELQDRGPGFYDLIDDKQRSVGSLACFGERCAFDVEYDGVSVNETLQLRGDRLEKFGTKSGPGFAIVWNETLHAR